MKSFYEDVFHAALEFFFFLVCFIMCSLKLNQTKYFFTPIQTWWCSNRCESALRHLGSALECDYCVLTCLKNRTEVQALRIRMNRIHPCRFTHIYRILSKAPLHSAVCSFWSLSMPDYPSLPNDSRARGRISLAPFSQSDWVSSFRVFPQEIRPCSLERDKWAKLWARWGN